MQKNAFLSGGGEMGALIRAHDWAGTPLGPPTGWPQALKSALRLILSSGHPMVIWWGPELVQFYNDAYGASLGADKHPSGLGQSCKDSWPETWDVIGPQIDQVVSGGAAIWCENKRLPIARDGQLCECYWTCSYNPIDAPEAPNGVGGVLVIVQETTAAVLAERRLEAASERQIRMFERAPGFIAIFQGPQHVFEFVNAAFVELFGEREYVGKSLGQSLPEMLGQDYFAQLQTVYSSGKRLTLQHCPIASSPAPKAPEQGRFFDLVYEPVTDNAGAVTGVFMEGYDVTETHLAHEALRASESQFRSFAQTMANHVWTAPPDGLLDWFNARVYEYSGYSVGELDGQGWARMVHPDDLASAANGWATALASGDSYEAEFRLARRDGVYRWHIARAAPIRDEIGVVVRWIGTNTDIEDQKATAQALRELNDTLEARVEQRTVERDRVWRNSQDVLVVIDGDGVFRAVSPAATRILGWAPEEMIGRSLFDFIVEEDLAATKGALAHASHGELPTMENRYRHRDGGYRWLSWTAALEGELIYATGRHVTAEKQAAKELASAQEALRQAQKMEAVGQLTGGLAHDFNNLLTGVTGSLEMLQRRMEQGRLEGVQRYIGAAQGAAKRAASLTQRLLAFSRRQTLDPKPTDINRLVAGMEELIRRTIGPRVEMEVVGAGGLWPSRIDRPQLENALLNLCINARDAMPDGGRLTIETANKWLDDRAGGERDLSPGQYVSLCVTDTGTGMTPDIIARAFDPFFTTKPLGEGTGLGLSMIYGFARQSGGQVRIYSEVGEGTTMCLYLPRHFGESDDADAVSSVLELTRTGDGRTVLVIDDEPTVRMLITEVLEEAGYGVLEAPDGPSGLKLLQSAARIDLLITDVGLPGGMNGRQVADAARSLRPELMVLFITGYAENAVIGNGHLDRGMQVLTKPFAMEALDQRIREMMEG